MRTQTIADVATRTEQALAAAANQGKAIQVVRTSGRNVTFGLTVLGPNGALGYPSPTQRLPGARAAVTAQRLMSWTYRDLYLQEGFSAAGAGLRQRQRPHHPALREAGSGELRGGVPRARPLATVFGGVSGPAPKPSCQSLPSAYPSWRAIISKALSCGLHLPAAGGSG